MKAILSMLAMPPISGFLAFLIFSGVLVLVDRFLLPIPSVIFWLIIGALAFAWLVLSGVWYWRRKRKNAAFVEEVAPEPDPTSELVSTEEKALQEKFSAAIKDLSTLRLKGKSGRSRYLYELPWYIFIGPPGAGKTEALKNCGLDFPLRKGGADIDIEGGAGTRNCNWVFTNDAVFIDTAGRYTTHSSDETVDNAAWHKFLDLLGKYRPREPINGVIVAISIADLATASNEIIDERAHAVRMRLDELYKRVNARVPVYLMFTKADRLVGFNEYFRDMGPEARKQVWGSTFPLKDAAAVESNLIEFDHEFDTLVKQLGAIQFRNMRDERSIEMRAKIFSFSSQFSSMKSVIRRFMQAAFEPNNFSDPVLLRGFYFTSATQVGQPVDRLIENLAQDFGIERQSLPSPSTAQGRSYFLSDLLNKVIFPEAGLVGQTIRTKAPLGRYAAITACIIIPLAVAGGLFVIHNHNREQADAFELAMRDYSEALANVEKTTIESSDPTPILPALNILKAEMNRLGETEPPLPYGLFIDRVPDLQDRARIAYDKALNTLLRPRILHMFEREVSRNVVDQGALYSALKAYLIVGGAKRSNLIDNRDFLKRRIFLSLEDILTERTGRASLEALIDKENNDGHVDAWLAQGTLKPWWSEAEPDINADLINRARNQIDIAVEERALEAMITEASAVLPDWSLQARAGRSMPIALLNAKGGVPETVVPALFTYRGFHEYFDTMAEKTIEAIRAEDWVTAEPNDFRESDEEIINRLERAYYERYIEEWRGVLEDLRIKPFTDTNSANAVLTALVAHTASPLKRILEEVVRETRLSDERGDSQGGESAAASAAQKESTRIIGESLQRRGSIGRIIDAGLGSKLSERPAGNRDAPSVPVERAFVDLHEFMEDDGLNRLLEQLRNFRREIVALSANGDTRPLSKVPAALDLKAALISVPPPVDSMLDTMLEQADMTRSKGARARIQEIWRSTVFQRCSRSLHDRYPFANSTDDISLGELSAVLGPDGLIDSFFNTHLAGLVDQGSWQWRPAGLALGISAEKLNFFRDAALIRQAIFANGTSTPGFELQVESRALEQDVEKLEIFVGGTPASFTPDDTISKALDWPGLQRAKGAAIIISRTSDLTSSISTDGVIAPTTAVPSQPEPISHSQAGSWGLFRMIDKAGYRTVNERSGRIQIVIDGTLVVFELRTTGSNPFAMTSTLRGFRCPASL